MYTLTKNWALKGRNQEQAWEKQSIVSINAKIDSEGTNWLGYADSMSHQICSMVY